jgi:3-dehydrosphinganine reductase
MARTRQPFAGKAVLIAGGSQGIGLAAAKQVVTLGGSACILAIGGLDEARDQVELLRRSDRQFVETIRGDATDLDALRPLLAEHIQRRGVPDFLFNFVGYAYAQYVENLTLADFRRNMEVNYYGQLVPTLLVLPHYLRQGRGGHVAFTSSLLGVLGLMGYATYAPTKHALVGLAETLRHELKPFGIGVSILYPPDTRTPGFAKENETKPAECMMISSRAKLLEPDQVAETFLRGVLKGRFQIFPGRTKLYWRLFRHLPRVARKVMDADYARARKKLGKMAASAG